MISDSQEKCPLQKMLESIGGKWKLLIIANLKEQNVVRFSALSRLLPGISQKVLTAQLKELEADGFVHREVYPEVPPRVEYSLTATGKSLYPVLDSMADWAQKNLYSE
ncbi:helix-turn-helix transcriptional regulator [Psychrobium sp. MM17-31]|uniref:winged helix-turn-helix transcriptional regulator n=1 Tax=Psychrobium sp. MM17-31 TaxID=2917758 RepID=UPI001EF3FA0E|nr:helix-turn-helix domain-containing protein [Psychrobium sp. MM17-31]MCG7532837.1 helix-turn-helix transcriptional regulator [Psychrobium sp. MM17-31]